MIKRNCCNEPTLCEENLLAKSLRVFHTVLLGFCCIALGSNANIGNRIGFDLLLLAGLATSFYNEKNRNIAHDLANLIVEASQELPDWLENVASAASMSRSMGGRGRSRGGGNFGGRDYRTGAGGNRGGGGYENAKEVRRKYTLCAFTVMAAAMAV